MRQLAVLAVVLPSLVIAQPSQGARTPPSTWSKDGYQQLRFGMGPGDVEDALRLQDTSLSTRLPLKFRKGAYEVVGHSVQIASVTMSVFLFFAEEALYRVWVRGPDYPSPNAEELQTMAALTLREKYGRPREEGGIRLGGVWIRGDLKIQHIGGPALRMATSIFYESQRLSEAPDRKQDQERERRRKRALNDL